MVWNELYIERKLIYKKSKPEKEHIVDMQISIEKLKKKTNVSNQLQTQIDCRGKQLSLRRTR